MTVALAVVGLRWDNYCTPHASFMAAAACAFALGGETATIRTAIFGYVSGLSSFGSYYILYDIILYHVIS